LLTISTPFQPGDALVTASGSILVANYFGGSIYEYSSTGQSMGLFSKPGLVRANFMALDSQGNLYVTDFMSGVVRKISSTGADEGNIITNIGGVNGITFDSHGNIYVAVASGAFNKVLEYSGSGAFLGTFVASGLNSPYGLTFGPDGNLYVADLGNNTIHEFSPTGTDLGIFASTGLDDPRSLVFNASVPEPSSALLLMVASITLFMIYPRSFRSRNR